MFEPFNEYRDKSLYEKKLYKNKVFFAVFATLLLFLVIAYGVSL